MHTFMNKYIHTHIHTHAVMKTFIDAHTHSIIAPRYLGMLVT